MATQPELSDEQRANLAKLATYLRTLPDNYPDFEMSLYAQDGNGMGWHRAHVACGTAACAVGHGPSAGILPLIDEEWRSYSERVFVTVDYSSSNVKQQDDAWDWMFDAHWSKVDNTAHGAAARIEWLLAHGLPEDAYEQGRGRAPLCYREVQP